MPQRFADRPIDDTADQGAQESFFQRRRTLLISVAALVAVAIVVAGLLVWRFGTGGNKYAASTPGKAVETFFDAARSGDLLAIAEMLPGAEREVLYPLIKESLAIGEESGATSSSDPRSLMAGVEVTIDDVQLSTRDLRDDLAMVTVERMTVGVEIDSAKMDPEIRDLVADGGRDVRESETVEITRNDGAFVMVVEDGGGWHVSAAYTLMEYAAQDMGSPGASRDVPTLSSGASSATAAVEDLGRALTDLVSDPSAGLDALAATLAPYEQRLIMSYRSMWEDEMSRTRSDIRIDDLDLSGLRAEGAGKDRQRVYVESGSVSGVDTDRGEDFAFTLDGTCGTAQVDGRRESGCLADLFDEVVHDPDAAITAGLLMSMFGDSGAYLTAVKDDGWHVSVLESFARPAIDLMTGSGGEDLVRMLGPVGASFATADETLELSRTRTVEVDRPLFESSNGSSGVYTSVIELTGGSAGSYAEVSLARRSRNSSECTMYLVTDLEPWDSDYIDGSYDTAYVSGPVGTHDRVMITCDQATSVELAYVRD